MRFHPNSRASIDHTPGPNMAREAARVARSTQASLSAGMMANLEISITATRVPIIGVQKPTMRRAPAPASRMEVMAMSRGGLERRAEAASAARANPTTALINTRPVPGQPPAKVEYKRRNWRTLPSYPFSCFSEGHEPPGRGSRTPLSRLRGEEQRRAEPTAR